MEHITLHNGETKQFEVSENEDFKFYFCETRDDAVTLSITLTDLGNVCLVDKGASCWHVRVWK